MRRSKIAVVPPPDSLEWYEAEATARKCAETIRQYWLDKGYDVPVEIKGGTRVVLPCFPGGFPPPEMKLP